MQNAWTEKVEAQDAEIESLKAEVERLEKDIDYRKGETTAHCKYMRELKSRLETADGEAKQWKAIATDWSDAADAGRQPDEFYSDYDEKPMRKMQAMLSKSISRAESLEAKVEKARNLSGNAICRELVVGGQNRLCAIMTKENYDELKQILVKP